MSGHELTMRRGAMPQRTCTASAARVVTSGRPLVTTSRSGFVCGYAHNFAT
jgi:hypothetical protein